MATALAGTACSDDEGTVTPPKPVNPGPFQVSVSGVTFRQAHVSVVPDDPEMIYYDHVVPKASFVKNWNSDVSRFLESYLEFSMENTGQTAEEIVEGWQVSGNDSWDYPYLEAGTEYVVFAVGMDDRGKPTTDPAFAEFTSAEAGPLEPVDCTFGIRVTDIDVTSANFTIEPSDKTVPYFYAILKASDWDAEADKQAYMHMLVKNAVDEGLDNSYSYEEALSRATKKGNYGGEIEPGALRAGTEYVVLAFGVDAYERASTDPAVKKFSTTPVTPSKNTFTITITESSAVDVAYHIETTNDDPYYAGVYSKETIGSLSDDQLISMLEKSYSIGDYYNGSADYTAEEMLFPDTEYQIIAVGYDKAATTAVTRKDFRTASGGNPADCRFEIEFAPSGFSVMVDVTPSDKSVLYYFDLIPVEEYPSDKELTAEVQDYLKNMSKEMDLPIQQIMLDNYARGDFSSEYATEALMQYYAVAYAFNNDGSPAGKVYKEPFTAPEQQVSSAVAQVECTKYYNGGELYEIDPEKYAGGVDWDGNPMAYALTTVTHSADAVTWYAGLFGDDVTGNSDASIIKNLIEYGGGEKNVETLSWKMAYFFDVPYSGGAGTANTFCAVALDKDGQYGPVFKKLFTPTLAGVSPIGEITGGANAIPARSPLLPKQTVRDNESWKQKFVRGTGKLKKGAEQRPAAKTFPAPKSGQAVRACSDPKSASVAAREYPAAAFGFGHPRMR